MISPFLNACSTGDLPAAAETPLETTQGGPISSTDVPLKPTQVDPVVLMDTPSPDQTEGAKSDPARIAFVKTQDRADGVHIGQSTYWVLTRWVESVFF